MSRLGIGAVMVLTIVFGAAPLASARRAAGPRKLYVDNTSGSTVSVIDLDTRKVVREIPVGLHPHGLGVLPDQTRLYVSVESDRTVKVIDPSSDAIVTSLSKPQTSSIHATWMGTSAISIRRAPASLAVPHLSLLVSH